MIPGWFETLLSTEAIRLAKARHQDDELAPERGYRIVGLEVDTGQVQCPHPYDADEHSWSVPVQLCSGVYGGEPDVVIRERVFLCDVLLHLLSPR